MNDARLETTERIPLRRVLQWIGCLASAAVFAAAAHGDWLVTRAGERIETEGGWRVEGRMVIFTRPGGTLSSLRLSEVDLDASREATARAAEAAARPQAQAPPPPRRPARVITTDDVGAGVPGAEDGDLLAERLRQAHSFQDVGLAMGLVNWPDDVTDGARDDLRSRFESLMERSLRTIRYVAAEAEELEPPAPGDVFYDFDLAGRLEVELFDDRDQSETTVTFDVGTASGSYFIVAPRESGE